jgi:hypothetical protein
MLTPQLRLEAYEWVVEKIKHNPVRPYMCCLLRNWCDINGVDDDEEDVLKAFPEMYNMCPEGTAPDCSWFPIDTRGNEQRLRVLDSCILMVQKEINKANQ